MKRYILFGAGVQGKKALAFLGNSKVICFCDNSIHAENETIDGIPIISISELNEYITDDSEVVITTTTLKYVSEISIQLNNLKIPFVLFEEIAARELIENDKKKYESINSYPQFAYRKDREYLISYDRVATAGTVSSYFWQDLWASKRIFNNPVEMHYDIGSRLDGFIAHVLSYGQKVSMIDIRPLPTKIDGLDFREADATNLESFEDECIESLSALCSIEHFGLGRYGDPIDPNACFKCFNAIQKKMKSGSNLYISVPIGQECLCFNAHRVFSISTILNAFSQFDLIELSSCYRDEFENDLKDIHKYDNWYDHEGDRMGLFWFRKK